MDIYFKSSSPGPMEHLPSGMLIFFLVESYFLLFYFIFGSGGKLYSILYN